MVEAGDGSLRKALYQLSVYEAQAKELSRQAELLQAGLEDIISARAALEALKSTKGAAIFPLGARVFVPAKQSKENIVLVDCGAGVMVEKSIDEAVAGLAESMKNIQAGLSKAQEQLTAVSKNASQLNEYVEQLSKKARG